jgi:hypothetical protein
VKISVFPPGNRKDYGADIAPPQDASAAGSTITVQDEGVTQSSTVTTLNLVGANVTASGAGATETITSILGSFTNDSRGRSTTDPLTVTRRTNLLSTTGLDTGAGFTCNSGVHFFRGTASWGGGFEMFLGCGVEAVNSDSRLCIGLTPAGGIIGGSTTEPSSAGSFTAAGGFFIGYDSTDTNIQVISNNTTTTGTKVDTGLARLTTAQWAQGLDMGGRQRERNQRAT